MMNALNSSREIFKAINVGTKASLETIATVSLQIPFIKLLPDMMIGI